MHTLENKGLRQRLLVPDGISGVVVTAVSPLSVIAAGGGAGTTAVGDGAATSSGSAVTVGSGVLAVAGGAAAAAGRVAAAASGEGVIQVDDVITHIDGRSIGDDYTVLLRGEELVSADFLITGNGHVTVM